MGNSAQKPVLLHFNRGGIGPGTRLLRVREVAEMLGVSQATIYQWMRERKMPCTRLGRRRMVSEGALARWIEQNTDYGDQSSTESQVPPGQ